ncbi:ankyrin repeat domain-containing protein [Pseudomonas sp.]|uniref:ankyrin repeat domain-containing protein n=1 Tax=Pseudomonas sp. TaxID=306 RepID=UPI0028AA662A|nr:ankyrin repeat domain-containing protein [Pseudomonas sp.]
MSEESIPKKMVEAIRAEVCEKIQRLLQENPEQISFSTPFGTQSWLGYAAQIGKLSSAKILVANGINVNTGDKRDDRKPICSAAANGHLELVEYLVNSGSILDTSLSVRNPLFAAVVGKSSNITELLLEAGVDSSVIYNSATMTNMDALAFALMRGEQKRAEIIAQWNAKNDRVKANALLEEAKSIAENNAFGRKPNKAYMDSPHK